MIANWIQSEELVIRFLVKNKQYLANSIDFVLGTAFPFPNEHLFAQDVYCAVNVSRVALGLDAGKKPGDIDMLVIPHKREPLFHRAMALEIKIVRPTVGKPGRNANSMGVTQVKGLLQDGFPVVGLLHICIPENLPESFHLLIPEKSGIANKNDVLGETSSHIKVDPFPILSSERQLGRLDAMRLPDQICYKSIGLSISQINGEPDGCTLGNQKRGRISDNLSKNLLRNIESIFVNQPQHFTIVRWFEN